MLSQSEALGSMCVISACNSNNLVSSKTLNTSLASWAELRHNTVLFVKQTVAAECGGDGYEKQVWIPEPPKGSSTIQLERLEFKIG